MSLSSDGLSRLSPAVVHSFSLDLSGVGSGDGIGTWSRPGRSVGTRWGSVRVVQTETLSRFFRFIDWPVWLGGESSRGHDCDWEVRIHSLFVSTTFLFGHAVNVSMP